MKLKPPICSKVHRNEKVDHCEGKILMKNCIASDSSNTYVLDEVCTTEKNEGEAFIPQHNNLAMPFCNK